MYSEYKEINKEYPLRTAKGVTAFFTMYHRLKAEAQTNSDSNLIILLIDFERACQAVEMTARQSKALDLVFHHEYTQREAGDVLGISQQAVNQLIQVVATNIAEAYADGMDVAGGE